MIGEGGVSLSRGEKQRISIARVMLKDAPIVIPDEVTANVDPENEGRLQKAVEALTRDKTILMIAYRLGTVRNVDPASMRILSAGKRKPAAGSCDRWKKKDRLCEKAETVFLGAFFRAGLYFGRF